MSDHILNNLNKIENDIYDIGSRIAFLLERIKEYLNGNILQDVNDSEFKIEELVYKLFSIKEEIHNHIDEIYNDSNFSTRNKIQNDNLEQINYLNDVLKSYQTYFKQ